MSEITYSHDKFDWKKLAPTDQDPSYWTGLRPFADLIKNKKALIAIATSAFWAYHLINPYNSAHAQENAPDLCPTNTELFCKEADGKITLQPEDPQAQVWIPLAAINDSLDALDQAIQANYPSYEPDKNLGISPTDYCVAREELAHVTGQCFKVTSRHTYDISVESLYKGHTPNALEKLLGQTPKKDGPLVEMVTIGPGRKVPKTAFLKTLDALGQAKYDANGRIINPEDITTLAAQALREQNTEAQNTEEPQNLPTQEPTQPLPKQEPIPPQREPTSESQESSTPWGTITAIGMLALVAGGVWAIVARTTQGEPINLPSLEKKTVKEKPIFTILGKPSVGNSPLSERDRYYLEHEAPPKPEPDNTTLFRIRALNEIYRSAREEAQDIVREDNQKYEDWKDGLQAKLDKILSRDEIAPLSLLEELETAKEKFWERIWTTFGDEKAIMDGIIEEKTANLNKKTKWLDTRHDY